METAAALAIHLRNLNRVLFANTLLCEGVCKELQSSTLELPTGFTQLDADSQSELDHALRAMVKIRDQQVILDAYLAAIKSCCTAAARGPPEIIPGSEPGHNRTTISQGSPGSSVPGSSLPRPEQALEHATDYTAIVQKKKTRMMMLTKRRRKQGS